MTKKIAIIGTNDIAVRLIADFNLPKLVNKIVWFGRDREKTKHMAMNLDMFRGSFSGGYPNSNLAEIVAGENMSDLAGADLVIITAGVSWPVGEFGDRLAELPFSAEIIEQYAASIKYYAPKSCVISVTNPLDTFIQYLLEETGFPPERVIGIGAHLDSTRFSECIKNIFIENNLPVKTCSAVAIGPHSGQNMVLLRSSILIDNKPLKNLIESSLVTTETLDKLLNQAEQNTYSEGFKRARILTDWRDDMEGSLETLIYLINEDKEYIGRIIDDVNKLPEAERSELFDSKNFLKAFIPALKLTSRVSKIFGTLSQSEQELKALWFAFINILELPVRESVKTLDYDLYFKFHIWMFIKSLDKEQKNYFFKMFNIEEYPEDTLGALKKLGIGIFKTDSLGPATAIFQVIVRYFNIVDAKEYSAWMIRLPINSFADTLNNRSYKLKHANFNCQGIITHPHLAPVSIFLPKGNQYSYGIEGVSTGVLAYIDQNGARPVDINITSEEQKKIIATAEELKRIKTEYGSIKQLTASGWQIAESLKNITDPKQRKDIYFKGITEHKERVKNTVNLQPRFFHTARSMPSITKAEIKKPTFSYKIPRLIRVF